MSFFESIYNAAKIKDLDTLREILTYESSIDEFEKNQFFSSPAGKLAREGDLESAYFLIYHFGARVDFVHHALLSEHIKNEGKSSEVIINAMADLESKFGLDKLFKGHCINESIFSKNSREQSAHIDLWTSNLAEESDQLYHPDINSLARISNKKHHIHAAICAGDMKFLKKREAALRYQADFEIRAYYLAQSGHLNLLGHLYSESRRLPQNISRWLADPLLDYEAGLPSIRFGSPELALHSLSFISNQDFFTALVDDLILNCSNFSYNIEEVAEKARKINHIMTKESIDYLQALTKCNEAQISLPPLHSNRYIIYNTERHVKDTNKLEETINCRLM